METCRTSTGTFDQSRTEGLKTKSIVKTGPRAEISPALLTKIKEQYQVGKVRSTRDLGGAYNLNVLIQASQGSMVVRVYRPWVTPERLLGIQRVKQQLHAAGIPVILPLKTTSSKTFIEIDQRLAEVEPYIPNQEGPLTAQRYESAASVLGRLHAVLAAFGLSPDIPSPEVENYSLPVDLKAGITKARNRIEQMTGDGKTQALGVCDLAETHLPRITEEWEHRGQFLPRQLVHGDFGPGNILFDQDQPAAIMDFDFIAIHERIFDLAYMLFWMFERLEPQIPFAQRSWTQVRAILRNYQAAMGQSLTADERIFLSIEIARVPLHWVAEAAQLPDPIGAVQNCLDPIIFAGWILEQKEIYFSVND